MSDEIEEVTELWTSRVYLYCPHCSALEEGFMGNPSGETFTCEECEKEYKVSPHADIDII